jgi:hypothetical protein
MKTCVCCQLSYPLEDFLPESHYIYCAFCYRWQNRIYAAFRRTGKRVRLSDLHRPSRCWRRTPELDALYLEAATSHHVSQRRKTAIRPAWHETKDGLICSFRRQIEAIPLDFSDTVNGAHVSRGGHWRQMTYTVSFGADVFRYHDAEDAARCVYRLTKEQEKQIA